MAPWLLLPCGCFCGCGCFSYLEGCCVCGHCECISATCLLGQGDAVFVALTGEVQDNADNSMAGGWNCVNRNLSEWQNRCTWIDCAAIFACQGHSYTTVLNIKIVTNILKEYAAISEAQKAEAPFRSSEIVNDKGGRVLKSQRRRAG